MVGVGGAQQIQQSILKCPPPSSSFGAPSSNNPNNSSFHAPQQYSSVPHNVSSGNAGYTPQPYQQQQQQPYQQYQSFQPTPPHQQQQEQPSPVFQPMQPPPPFELPQQLQLEDQKYMQQSDPDPYLSGPPKYTGPPALQQQSSFFTTPSQPLSSSNRPPGGVYTIPKPPMFVFGAGQQPSPFSNTSNNSVQQPPPPPPQQQPSFTSQPSFNMTTPVPQHQSSFNYGQPPTPNFSSTQQPPPPPPQQQPSFQYQAPPAPTPQYSAPPPPAPVLSSGNPHQPPPLKTQASFSTLRARALQNPQPSFNNGGPNATTTSGGAGTNEPLRFSAPPLRGLAPTTPTAAASGATAPSYQRPDLIPPAISAPSPTAGGSQPPRITPPSAGGGTTNRSGRGVTFGDDVSVAGSAQNGGNDMLRRAYQPEEEYNGFLDQRFDEVDRNKNPNLFQWSNVESQSPSNQQQQQQHARGDAANDAANKPSSRFVASLGKRVAANVPPPLAVTPSAGGAVTSVPADAASLASRGFPAPLPSGSTPPMRRMDTDSMMTPLGLTPPSQSDQPQQQGKEGNSDNDSVDTTVAPGGGKRPPPLEHAKSFARRAMLVGKNDHLEIVQQALEQNTDNHNYSAGGNRTCFVTLSKAAQKNNAEVTASMVMKEILALRALGGHLQNVRDRMCTRKCKHKELMKETESIIASAFETSKGRGRFLSKYHSDMDMLVLHALSLSTTGSKSFLHSIKRDGARALWQKAYDALLEGRDRQWL